MPLRSVVLAALVTALLALVLRDGLALALRAPVAGDTEAPQTNIEFAYMCVEMRGGGVVRYRRIRAVPLERQVQLASRAAALAPRAALPFFLHKVPERKKTQRERQIEVEERLQTTLTDTANSQQTVNNTIKESIIITKSKLCIRDTYSYYE